MIGAGDGPTCRAAVAEAITVRAEALAPPAGKWNTKDPIGWNVQGSLLGEVRGTRMKDAQEAILVSKVAFSCAIVWSLLVLKSKSSTSG